MSRDLRKPTPNPTLEDAWRLFATYDLNSKLTSHRFTRIRWISLVLGVVATSLALVYEIILPGRTPIIVFGSVTLRQIVGFLVILLPISVSVLLTILSKLERGENWILLRGTAEAIKHEIFKFRSRTDIYSDINDQIESREIRLARRMKTINERLMLTEVNQSNLRSYSGSLPPPIEMATTSDDGFSYLSPSQYFKFRLEDQIKWYKKRTNQMDRRITLLQYQIILFGALGTLLAALGFAVWIYITTAVVGAITNYMEFYQYEKIITSYNMAAADLQSIRIWWRALSEPEKNTPEKFERLVSLTEGVMRDESQRWTHTIRDAIEKLEAETEEAGGDRPAEAPHSSIPEGQALTPVDLTPADILAGNWGGAPPSPEASFIEPVAAYEPKADVFPIAPKPEGPRRPEVEELFDLSPEEIDALDDLEVKDQGKGELFPEELEESNSSADDLSSDDLNLPFGDLDLSEEDVNVDDFVPGELRDGNPGELDEDDI